eukprot:9189905-Pyramimonas_sp.AAC.1
MVLVLSVVAALALSTANGTRAISSGGGSSHVSTASRAGAGDARAGGAAGPDWPLAGVAALPPAACPPKV